MTRIPRAAGLLAWTLGLVGLNAVVPHELSQLGGRAGRPAPAAPAARGAGLLLVAAGGALTAWAVAAHYQAAPQGWALESRPTPGYLLRTGPYRWSRNPMYAGEAAVWAGWALFYASPAVWAGLVIVSAAVTTLVPWEERWLLERFGEDYRAYLADVPRWVPRAPRRPGPRRSAPVPGRPGPQPPGRSAGERALPLIMTWRADKRVVNTAEPTHYERVLVRCSRAQTSCQLEVRRLLLRRSLAVDGCPGTSRGHAGRTPVMRRLGARRRGAALSCDRPLFRAGISQIGARCASAVPAAGNKEVGPG